MNMASVYQVINNDKDVQNQHAVLSLFVADNVPSQSPAALCSQCLFSTTSTFYAFAKQNGHKFPALISHGKFP